MLRTVFDTAPLVTSCKFQVGGGPIIDQITGHCSILIPPAVEAEVTAYQNRYPDAAVAAERIKRGQITVASVRPLPADNVLSYYGLGEGEKEAIALALELQPPPDFLVIDDNLAYIVSDRLGATKSFLLDLVLTLVEQKGLTTTLAEEIINVVRPRYSDGLIRHSLKMLEKGDRQCLW